MPRSTGYRRPLGRGARLNKGWCSFTFDKTALTATQLGIIACVVAEGGGDSTVLRSLGDILVIATPDAATDDDTCALGLIVVQNSAFAANGVALPGPINDIDADWLWWEAVPVAASLATSGIDNARNLIHRVKINSKGMRRMATDQSLVLMGELKTAEMAAVTVNGGMRILFGV